MSLINLIYKIKNNKVEYTYPLFQFRNKEISESVRNNVKFERTHQNQRCFILGNGPSLKNQDLKLLRNETVFTVNQISRHPDFKYIKTNYHFWADPVFFNISKDNQEDMELLKIFKSINTEDNRPICFLPNSAFDFVNKFSLSEELNIAFYIPMYEFHEKYSRKIDYKKFVPGFHTVVHYAISMAIFMGFNEIYLMGCDSTGILSAIESILDEDYSNSYGYEISKNEAIRLTKQYGQTNIEKSFYGWWKIFEHYRTLHNYCELNDIKLINCSSNTIIDSIPRMKYEEVLSFAKNNE